MSLKRLALWSFILLAGNASLPAQNIASPAAPGFAPPWVVHSENSLWVAFDLKPDDVRQLLPKGVEPLLNKQGMVGAILEMYETKRISGLPNYKTAFIIVEIQGHDSREGTSGHFAVWGRVSPQESLAAFRSNFGLPYKYDANISLGMERDAQVGAVGPPGKEILKVKVAPIAEQAFESQGAVNMVGMNADNGTVKSEVPYITRGNSGKVLSLEVRTRNDPVLKLITNATPTWALVSKDRIFSWSHAVFAD